MAVYTVTLNNVTGPDVVTLTDGSTYATLEVSAGRGPKGDGWTGGSYSESTGVVTFTSNDGLGFATGDLRPDLSEPDPIGDVTPNTGAFTSLSTTGDTVIGGDLTVNGTTTTVNTQTLDVADKNITVAYGAADPASANGGGLTVDGADATLTYQSAGDNWALNKDLSVSGDITLTGTVDGRDVAADGSVIDGLGTISTQDNDSVDINGGTIDGTVIGGSSAAAITGTTITGTSFASSGDMSFGDNDKAIFGAGSDLQIYHDGTQSFISDQGTGSMFLRSGGNIYIQNAGGTANYFKGTDGGASELFHNGSPKLATTSTGIDVTGTVTADGLTVDGDIVFSDSAEIKTNNFGQSITFGTGFGGTDRMQISSGGDITFYDTSGNASFVYDESAGSTFNENGDNKDFRVEGDSDANMLFVDAGNNRIGMGLSNPDRRLHVYHATDNVVAKFESGDEQLYLELVDSTSSASSYLGVFGDNIVFRPLNAETVSFQNGESVFNEQSRDDVDFRVESDSNANMLFVDAGNDHVNIGTSSNFGAVLNVAGDVIVQSTGLGKVEITSSSANSTDSAALDLMENIGGFGNLGAYGFRLKYDGNANKFEMLGGNQDSVYKWMEMVRDNGYTTFYNDAGADRFHIGTTDTVVNDSSHDYDFRVESDSNTHMLFVDAGDNKVGVGTGSPASVLDVYSSSVDSDGILRVYQNVATNSPTMKILQRGEGGSQNTNQGLLIDIAGHNEGNAYILNTSVTNSNINGGIAISPFSVKGLGTFQFRQGGVINENGADSDFRVESDSNANALVVNAGANAVLVNTNAQSSTGFGGNVPLQVGNGWQYFSQMYTSGGTRTVTFTGRISYMVEITYTTLANYGGEQIAQSRWIAGRRDSTGFSHLVNSADIIGTAADITYTTSDSGDTRTYTLTLDNGSTGANVFHMVEFKAWGNVGAITF